ncbi:MAG: hypothetical protein ACSHXK_16925, partial [Oceanococcus sp.]
ETEGYIVEKQSYFFDHDADQAVDFSVVPEWLPDDAKVFLRLARNLPIDASHQDIVTAFSDRPQFKYSGGALEKYIWRADQAFEYRIAKYKGCISQLLVFVKDLDGKSVFVSQKNRLADTSGYGGKPKKGDCAYRSLKETWTYLINGEPSKKYSENPPLDLIEIDSAFDGYNRRKKIMTSKVGEPEIIDGKLVWEIAFGSDQKALVTLSVTDNCATERVVTWKGQDGLAHKIVGKFDYLNKQERVWYTDALDLALRAWFWLKSEWEKLKTSF